MIIINKAYVYVKQVVVGLCSEVTESYIIIELKNNEYLKFFFSSRIDISCAEKGKITKIEGQLSTKDILLPIVDEFFQLKEPIN